MCATVVAGPIDAPVEVQALVEFAAEMDAEGPPNWREELRKSAPTEIVPANATLSAWEGSREDADLDEAKDDADMAMRLSLEHDGEVVNIRKKVGELAEFQELVRAGGGRGGEDEDDDARRYAEARPMSWSMRGTRQTLTSQALRRELKHVTLLSLRWREKMEKMADEAAVDARAFDRLQLNVEHTVQVCLRCALASEGV